MNIAILHPQCRVRGGAIKMALLSAQAFQKQGHHVIFYTFDHDPECFPELQDGLTIVTAQTRKKMTVDTVDTPRSFFGKLFWLFPRFFSIVSMAWDIRQVDIVIAHNPPMQIVGAFAKICSLFSEYHQRMTLIWWHHHVPWYYVPRVKKVNATAKQFDILLSVANFFSVKGWKGWFERHYIIPRVKYMIATSHYTAYCVEQYCKRKSVVIHPVITNMSDEVQNAQSKIQNEGTRPITLFSHGRLEPGKGFDALVKVWKELQMQNTQSKKQNEEIRLVIAGEGLLKKWLIEQGATVISYQESVLEDIKKTESDILAIYLSTIDAFGMAPVEAQIAGLPTIILDRGGARETVLLDKNGDPEALLLDSEKEILPAITYFIQQRSLQKRVSNVNFCHHREYFNVGRLDADIRSLIDSIG